MDLFILTQKQMVKLTRAVGGGDGTICEVKMSLENRIPCGFMVPSLQLCLRAKDRNYLNDTKIFITSRFGFDDGASGPSGRGIFSGAF